jgi:hypothetical protein
MTDQSHPLPSLMMIIGKRLAVLIVVPLLVIVTLLLLLSKGLHQYPLAVCSEDQGFDMPMAGHLNVPETLVKALDAKAFAITTTATPAEARRLYDEGKAKVLLCFPAYLSEDIMIRRDDPTYVMPNKISFQLAETNPLARIFVLSAIGRTALAALQENGGGISLDSLPIPLDIQPLLEGFDKAPTYVFLALFAFVSWVLTGILSLQAARKLRGRAWLRPGSGGILGQAVFITAFAVAGWALYLCLALFGFLIMGMSLPAGFMAGAAIVLLLLACAAALAFAAGLSAHNARFSRPVYPFLILPLFFSGFLFPAELMPVWLQWIKFLFPPHYGLTAALAVQLDAVVPATAAYIAGTACWLLGFWALGLIVLRHTDAAGKPATHIASTTQGVNA